LLLTDGKGAQLTCVIIEPHAKKCKVQIASVLHHPPPTKQVSIAISLVKNANRFEWFLEKATEIGVTEIIPLLCERTERQHFRYERMKGIVVSAMLQSQQCWMPVLHDPKKIADLQNWKLAEGDRMIAHCEDSEKYFLNHHPISKSSNYQILIGPEGDFTSAEIEQALRLGYAPVSLGTTRLRTETAGVVAATLLCMSL
jgi:16S rRNA (uracil1498-N3)-methyltransferase